MDITDDSLALRYKNYRNALDNSKFGSGVVGFITAGGNVLISNVSGEDTVETVMGLGVDVALTLMELTPAGRVINIALTLTGFDPATKLKDIYRSLAYESEADYNNNKIAKLVGAKSVTIEKNILKVTMPDGTVYARPLSASFFPYGVTPSGLLTGGNDYTNDVLFGVVTKTTHFKVVMVATYSSVATDLIHTMQEHLTLSVIATAKAEYFYLLQTFNSQVAHK